MPQLITREAALAQIGKEISPGECLVCHLLKKESARVLQREAYATVLLSSYPRFWGQVMLCVNRHVESYSELKDEEWEELSHFSLEYARRLETQLQPVRVYIAALGAPQPLPHTCPHLHVNLLPVYDAQLKPSEALTWTNGLYAGSEEEWQELFQKLSAEF